MRELTEAENDAYGEEFYRVPEPWCTGCRYGWPEVAEGSTVRGYICTAGKACWHEMPEEVHAAVCDHTRMRLDPIEAERDELWSAMQRVALNLCDCDARDGHECPVYPAEHREHCEYALAHRKRGEDDNALIEWDDPNFSLA